MYLVTIAWVYVVLMMALAEATNPTGTVLGAIVTFLLYGALPLSIVLYVMGAPARRRARRASDMAASGRAPAESGGDPDGSGHAAGDAVASERKEP